MPIVCSSGKIRQKGTATTFISREVLPNTEYEMLVAVKLRRKIPPTPAILGLPNKLQSFELGCYPFCYEVVIRGEAVLSL